MGVFGMMITSSVSFASRIFNQQTSAVPGLLLDINFQNQNLKILVIVKSNFRHNNDKQLNIIFKAHLK